ncbi:hypothetical protein Dimus_006227, partial [Dionaea muscipula]
FEREIWLSCYGVPVHAWNASTFMAIGQHWGEVVQVEEDTLKCTRCDISKIKIISSSPSVINQQMKLVVGWKSFIIRVAEEQATFICNSDFTCGCLCHRGEDEQSRSDSTSVDGDDVEEGINGRNSGSRDDCSRLLITGSPNVTDGNHDKERNTYSLGEGEMRGFVLAADEEMNQQVGLDLGEIGGSEISGGELTLYNEALVGRNGARPPIGPMSGPVFNTRGINLEVMLSPNVGPVNNGLNDTGLISEAHQVSPIIRNEFDSEGEMEETTGAQIAGCFGPRLHSKIRGKEYTGISQGDVHHEQNNDG